MALNTDMRIAAHRLVMFALGGCSGLALWALADQWKGDAIPPSLYLALFSFFATYASVALALSGPVPVARALWGALTPAVVLAGLMSVAGLRHPVAIGLLDDPVSLTVAAVLVLFSTPFLMVWLQDRAAWLTYARLFDAAWTMTVRYSVAWGFVVVFWLIAFLSDALLTLVDVNVIEQMLRQDWARFAASGAVLGLGLAVIYELRDTISPYLFLRLLRLLVPVVLAVVGVFLISVPIRGLAQLFGEFSAAGTLMGAAMVSITLISAALDQGNWAAVQTRGIRVATRILAVVLPLLAGLAVWAVVLRVRQYGLTPDRVLAMTVALFLLAYGLGYCGAVLLRAGWMDRIRHVNVAMALGVIGVSVIWMTPVLDAYRLSTNSQVARFTAGQASVGQLPLWQMAHDWGRAGQAGLARLEAQTDHPDHDLLAERIAIVRTEDTPFQFEQAMQRGSAPDRAAQLQGLMPVRPAGTRVGAGFLAAMPSFRLDQWLAGCQRKLPDGRAGCVLVQGAFSPAAPAQDQGIVLFLDEDGNGRAIHMVLRAGRASARDVFDPVTLVWPTLPGSVVARALDGELDIRPSGTNALYIGGKVLAPGQ